MLKTIFYLGLLNENQLMIFEKLDLKQQPKQLQSKLYSYCKYFSSLQDIQLFHIFELCINRYKMKTSIFSVWLQLRTMNKENCVLTTEKGTASQVFLPSKLTLSFSTLLFSLLPQIITKPTLFKRNLIIAELPPLANIKIFTSIWRSHYPLQLHTSLFSFC